MALLSTGSYRHGSPLRYFVEQICSLARNLHEFCNSTASSTGLMDFPTCETAEPLVNRGELDCVAKSLIISFELEQGQYSLKSEASCLGNTQYEEAQTERGDATTIWIQKGGPKQEYKLETSRESSPSRIHWV